MPIPKPTFTQFASWFSPDRVEPYVAACGGNRSRAIHLYAWNARATGAFVEVMHHVEVLLRNRIADTLAGDVGRRWYTSPVVLTPAGLGMVTEALDRIRRGGKRATYGQVIASLTFGFWTGLFGASAHNEDLWRRHLHKTFRRHGPGRRKDVAGRLAVIRIFRNRLAHHEPIHGQNLVERHEELLELAAWLDPAAEAWIRKESRVPTLPPRP